MLRKVSRHATKPLADPEHRKTRPGPGRLDTEGQILNLQRSIGNKALLRMVKSGRIVQTAKDDEARSKKHRRVARAKATISQLKDNLPYKIEDHIFNGKPSDGGDYDYDNPVGLHAYTNGLLPRHIVPMHIRGNPNKVHILLWGYRKGHAIKTSTMFPIWMTRDEVCTLIALKFPSKFNVDLAEVYQEDTLTYIQKGLQISVARSGKTVYPVL